MKVIPNQTNVSVNPHLSFDQFKQNKDSNISKVNIIKPTVPTVGNPSDKTDKGKQVSIDGGKTCKCIIFSDNESFCIREF